MSNLKPEMGPCPVASAFASSSTGVWGSASQSDAAITADHSSEWQSGSTQRAGGTVQARG